MNTKLQKIFNEDQKDRLNLGIINNPTLFNRRDNLRKSLVMGLLKNEKEFTAKDFYMAAMIFHHGSRIIDSKKAINLAEKSIEMGYEKAKVLYATGVDRLLLRQGKRQKFGTQYNKKDNESPWVMLPIDPKTSDKERAKYNLPTLQVLKKRIIVLNKNEKSKTKK
jgi:hypothetical protein